MYNNYKNLIKIITSKDKLSVKNLKYEITDNQAKYKVRV